MRQIHCAIEHLSRGDFEATITLAAAAEGMLPEPDKNYLFQKIKALAPEPSKDASQANGANDYVVWLKHGTGPDGNKLQRATIMKIEMYALVLRAISKFHALYDNITPQMIQFWKEASDHLSADVVPSQP